MIVQMLSPTMLWRGACSMAYTKSKALPHAVAAKTILRTSVTTAIAKAGMSAVKESET